LLPERLLDVTLHGSRVVPRWLTGRDHGWVRDLQDEVAACVGLPRDDIATRLGRVPDGTPRRAHRALLSLLLEMHGWETSSALDPVRLRSALFAAAGAAPPGTPRDDVIRRAALSLGIDPGRIESSLYADVPGARLLRPFPTPSTVDLVQRYNLALAQGLLLRAEHLRVRAAGRLKVVLRVARLRGLICEVETPATSLDDAVLAVSGPLSIFRFTTKYGRAMAGWLPVLAAAPAWSIEARCLVAGERRTWTASHLDPIGTPVPPPRRFDSRVEERLFRDLRRVAPGWDVLREADPVRAGDRVICPDFTLVDRDRGLRVPLEVVGFWTPDYLRRKVETLAALPPDAPWVVCIDESLCASPADLPPGPVFRYRAGRIDAAHLLEFIEKGVASRAL
jgi:predicted nuclease of restriction endonuclease-like RecB superfamily